MGTGVPTALNPSGAAPVASPPEINIPGGVCGRSWNAKSPRTEVRGLKSLVRLTHRR